MSHNLKKSRLKNFIVLVNFIAHDCLNNEVEDHLYEPTRKRTLTQSPDQAICPNNSQIQRIVSLWQ